MRANIDKFGRITLPKMMRLHLGIDTDSLLEIKEEENTIVIQVATPRVPTTMENGVLVYTGKALGDFNSVLEGIREDRLEDF